MGSLERGIPKQSAPERQEKRYFLTANQAKVVEALEPDTNSTIAELAATARLTPSAVKKVVSGLSSKGFVNVYAGPRTEIQLSSEGRKAKQIFVSHSAVDAPARSESIFISPERSTKRGIELDQALDEAISDLNK
jgi:DNA-binding MarR family transcriptional regulator